jgi:hypothetical protein
MIEFRVAKLTGFYEYRVERREHPSDAWEPVRDITGDVRTFYYDQDAKVFMAKLRADINDALRREAATWEPIA